MEEQPIEDLHDVTEYPYDDAEYPHDQAEGPFDESEYPYDQADKEIYVPTKDPYREVVYRMNGTFTANHDQPDTAPLRIKLGNFRTGNGNVQFLRSHVRLANIHIAFSSDKPSLYTRPLGLPYPLPPELVFGKPVGPDLDIWYLGLIVSTQTYFYT